MASKNKRRNMNNHKSRGHLKIKSRFCPAKFHKPTQNKNFVFVAVDTNIIFNIIDIIKMRDFKNHAIYSKTLKDVSFLFDHNVYNQVGNFNISGGGNLVLIVTDHVYEEAMKNLKYAKYRKDIKELIDKTMVRVTFDKNKMDEFNKITYPLAKALIKNEIFTREGVPTKDLQNWLEAACLNLTFVTYDSDFGIDSKSKNNKIKSISAKKLHCDHNGFMAEPMSLNKFKKLYLNNENFSCIQNTHLLEKDCAKSIAEGIPPLKNFKETSLNKEPELTV